MKNGDAWAGGRWIMLLVLLTLVIFIMLPLVQPLVEGVHQLAAVLGN